MKYGCSQGVSEACAASARFPYWATGQSRVYYSQSKLRATIKLFYCKVAELEY